MTTPAEGSLALPVLDTDLVIAARAGRSGRRLTSTTGRIHVAREGK